MSDLKEMQCEELQALQAIFMDDYTDYTKGNNPPEISLHLTPMQSIVGNDIHVRLDLRVKYTTCYPKDPPLLGLENAKGISNEQLSELKNDLKKLAEDLCGEVMVLQLAHHVQSFLHLHNTPNLSFFDQMLVNQQKQEEKVLSEQRKMEEVKNAEDKEHGEDVMRQVKEELIKREEVLKQEKRKRKISQSSPVNSYANGSKNPDTEIVKTKSFMCERSRDCKMSVMVFHGKHQEKKVFCSVCIGHFFDYACSFLAIDEVTGKTLSLVEWKIKWVKKNTRTVANDDKVTQENVDKQLQSIQQEFSFLRNKLSCGSLLNYLFLDISQDSHHLIVRMLIDPISGPSLATYIQDGGVSLSFIRNVCEQLLFTLNNLHSKSVVHRDLNLNNTFINGSNQVVVGGYAVMKRISEFAKLFEKETDEKLQQDYAKAVKPGKKGDVFNLGVLLLALYNGDINHASTVIIPDHVKQPFRSFLKSCLAENETERWSIPELLKHRFLHEKLSESHITGNACPILSNEDSEKFFERKVEANDVAMPLWSDRLVYGKSRLTSEFEMFQWLGKGGFGSVLKVKNKLDGNFYAIKRIPLNPKSLHLNKRITREVKLLSRLNHENVVRYYNSWIEAEDVDFPLSLNASTESEKTSVCQHKTGKQQQIPKVRKPLEESLLQINDVNSVDIPAFYTPDNNVDSWLDVKEASFSSSDSSEDDGRKSKLSVWKMQRKNCESSEGVVFQPDDSVLQFGDELDTDDDESEDDRALKTHPSETTDTSSNEQTLQHLYIQMEFCEKNTLKTAIDEGLYKQPERVWKLFREIVEGIAHVHSQGIIHRDLKPVNIFMDSYDRIKIGDFGLATSHTSFKPETASFISGSTEAQTIDERMTGKVGTALYVAPELGQAHNRIRFSQKVDMYSLGIILFEMFFRPLDTGMERVKTIGMLRNENIAFPESFNDKRLTKERIVISWLLNHSPDARPSAKELVESGYMPPKMEDSQLDELIKHTLNQSNSTRYQRLVSAFFSQGVSPVSDQIYDSDCHGKNEDEVMQRARILKYVKLTISDIFLKHGAVLIDTPLLMPKGKIYDDTSKLATVIDPSGLHLCLPYDSRISFARYVIRNNCANVRRFSFGKLYRDQGILGAHPIALWDCSFDIISESFTNLLPEAEVIYTVCEIIKEFPNLHQRNYYIRINHTSFLKAIFLQSNLNDETQKEVYRVLEQTRDKNLQHSVLADFFMSIGLTDHAIAKLLSFLSFEGSLAKAKESLQLLRKSKPSISLLTKQAFQSIECVLKLLGNMEVDLPIQICTSLIHNVNHYSGILFQFVAENTRKRKRGGVDILAVGGCYDELLKSMSKYVETSHLPKSVGVSIAVEKIIAAVQKEYIGNDTLRAYVCKCDVLLCTLETSVDLHCLVQVLHELWKYRINAMLFSYDMDQCYTVEEMQEYCKENGINHLVVIKDYHFEDVRVRSRDRENFWEMKVARADLTGYLGTKLRYEGVVKEVESTPKPCVPRELSLSFTFVSFEKDSSGKKKKHESNFMTKFHHDMQRSFGNVEVQVVMTNLDRLELKSVAAHLELSGTYEEFESSVRSITDMFKEQGLFLKRLCNTLRKVYTESHSVLVLYTYIDEYYKVFI